MLVQTEANPAETGTNGVNLVAQAEKLEALLWQQVLTCMTQTATPDGALGTGSDLYNGMVTDALSSTMASSASGGLTQSIVGELKSAMAGKTGTGTSTAASLSARAETSDQTTTGGLAQAVSYAKSVWPAIKATAAKLNVPPEAILAQSALETGWGASTPGNNLFGIKAVGEAAATTQSTSEEIGGVLQPAEARFAAYGSSSACLSQYEGLIQRVYPQAMGAGSVAQYAQALASGGYATDSSYAQKIVATARSPLMQSVLSAVEGSSS